MITDINVVLIHHYCCFCAIGAMAATHHDHKIYRQAW